MSAITPIKASSLTPAKTGANALTAKQRKEQADFMRMLVANLSSRLHKSKIGLLNETYNPLWNVNEQQVKQIYDFARSGNYAQIQQLYHEVENCDPTFLVCTERRCSAMSVLDWRVKKSDERINRKYLRNNQQAESLIQEQIDCLEETICKIDNLTEALQHFALAPFRGFSVVNVWHDINENPTHLECLDHRNICFDRESRDWLWNPNGTSYLKPSKNTHGMELIPRDDMIAVARKRQIDWPALQIFLRNAIGERDWGRFLETYGLPPVIITMPEFTSKEDQQAYMDAAAAVFEGRSGVVPHDSQVNYASESRGTDPFSGFIEHQMKLYVLLATGGTLTSLAEAGSGTLAGNAQMRVWEQITFGDRRIVSEAFNKQLCREIINRNFPKQPVFVDFEFYAKPDYTADELLEMAGKANSAGFEMDPDELSQEIGYKIRKPAQSDGGMGFNSSMQPVVLTMTPQQTAISADKPHGGATVAPNADKQTGNAPSAQTQDLPPTATGEENPAEALAESLQTDFKAVADEIVKILALPEEQRAGAAAELLKNIDSLIPEDPTMAEVIAEQMKAAFASQLAKGA